MRHRCHSLIFGFLLLAFGPPSFVDAQSHQLLDGLKTETRLPWSPGEARYIRKWLVVGAFASLPQSSENSLEIDYLLEHGGEARIQPTEGMSHVREGSSSVKWHPLTSWGDAVFLTNSVEGPDQDAVAYAFATILRRERSKAVLSFGSDEGSRVWINGKMVLDYKGSRSLTLDEDRIVIDLEAGENYVLIKVVQHVGPWSFAARILEEGSALPRPVEIGPSIVRDTDSELEVKTDVGGERPDPTLWICQIGLPRSDRRLPTVLPRLSPGRV